MSSNLAPWLVKIVFDFLFPSQLLLFFLHTQAYTESPYYNLDIPAMCTHPLYQCFFVIYKSYICGMFKLFFLYYSSFKERLNLCKSELSQLCSFIPRVLLYYIYEFIIFLYTSVLYIAC
jgi:hypothetical protein